MVNEICKIMGLLDLCFIVICVWVFVLRVYFEVVNIEFEFFFLVDEVCELFEVVFGVELIDDLVVNCFLMLMDVIGCDLVVIGWIWQDISDVNVLEFWLCGDQICKGVVFNVVQIVELLIKK